MFTRIRHAHHLKTIFGLSSDYNPLNGRSRRTNISLAWNFTNFISRKWRWHTVKQERLVSIALCIPCELCRLYSTSLSSVLFVYSASRVRVSVSQIALIVVKAILLFVLFKIDRSNNNKKWNTTDAMRKLSLQTIRYPWLWNYYMRSSRKELVAHSLRLHLSSHHGNY